MATQNEEFIQKLFNACESHGEWLRVVDFGLKSLLENKHLFIDILIREAFAEAETVSPEDVAFALSRIFNDLQIEFKEASE